MTAVPERTAHPNVERIGRININSSPNIPADDTSEFELLESVYNVGAICGSINPNLRALGTSILIQPKSEWRDIAFSVIVPKIKTVVEMPKRKAFVNLAQRGRNETQACHPPEQCQIADARVARCARDAGDDQSRLRTAAADPESLTCSIFLIFLWRK